MPYKVKTISELHQLRGVPGPAHPLISVVDIATVKEIPSGGPPLLVADFYLIGLKKDYHGSIKIKYGQQEYDFDEGVLSFMAPGQVFGMELEGMAKIDPSGWFMAIHPDFLWNTTLAKKIRQYEFFNYAVNEALFLSEKEEQTIIQIIQNIARECHSNVDKFSHSIIISHLEALLNYADRYYQRQFMTRRRSSHQLVDQVESLLEAYFEQGKGLPSVSHIAGALHVSPDYLSSLLKTLTGLNTQQHIHQKLLEKAKLLLSTTDLAVSEIAYQLGFEHPQSFSKLFKTKTKLSPAAFRTKFR